MISGIPKNYFDPFWAGQSQDKSLLVPALRWSAMLVGTGGFAGCLTCLYLAMRDLMLLGGFVATGGPYAISHPAPGWSWLIPASILAGVGFIFISESGARRSGGLRLVLLSWPATFIALGYNFLDFGFHPANGASKAVWAWLLCGFLFWLMGLAPLPFILVRGFKFFREASHSAADAIPAWTYERLRAANGKHTPRFATYIPLLLLHALAVACGIFAGTALFRQLTR